MSQLELILEKPSGEKFLVLIKIGKPYEIKDGKGPDIARCPVSMKGLHENLRDVTGESTFQALTLAIGLVKRMLSYFIEDGGQIYMNDGKSKFEFKSYFTGFEH